MGDFFADYQVGDFFDEMFSGPGVVRPHYSKLFARFKEMERKEFEHKRARAASTLLTQGVTASDAEVTVAVGFSFRELKLVVEPGGAVGLAALLAGHIDARDKNVVIVLSGGNVDADMFAELIR